MERFGTTQPLLSSFQTLRIRFFQGEENVMYFPIIKGSRLGDRI